MTGATDDEAELDRCILAFLDSRVGDDAWIVADLIAFLEAEHPRFWLHCRVQLAERNASGWAAALVDRLTALEAATHFQL